GSTCGWHTTSIASAEVMRHDTTPRMLARNAREHPDLIAQREKEFGIWTAYTWRSIDDHVRRMATGLAGLGVAPGDVVVLIGDNRPAWVWGEIPLMPAGLGASASIATPWRTRLPISSTTPRPR